MGVNVNMKVKLVILLILLAGVISVVVWQNHMIAYHVLYCIGFHPSLSLCDLAQNPEWYDGKAVRVRGQVQSIGDSLMLCDLPCKHPDAFSCLNVEKLKAGADQYARLLQALDEPGDENHYRMADVEVRGTFDSWYTQGCFAPRFGITVDEFHALSLVRTVPIPAGVP